MSSTRRFLAASADAGESGEVAALQAALATEHAALWAYGLVSGYNADAAAQVTEMVGNHQTSRDAAADLIVAAGAAPVGPEPAYTTPMPMTDAASALALAVVIESDCAAAWRAVIGNTDDAAVRGTAFAVLTDCAVRAVTWRTAAGIQPRTEPFPGSAAHPAS